MGKNTRTILICSGKGGVGKTTLTANLGIALANSGATTAVLDADFGLRNLDLLLGLENRIIKEAIVVTNPELSAVRDADRVIGILNTSDIEPIQLVINRVRPNMMASQEMLSIEDVQGILSLPLLGIVLEDEQVIISTNRGEPLTLSDGRSPAKKCYLNVSQRLTNKDVPIIDPKKEGKSLKDKFMRLMQTKVF